MAAPGIVGQAPSIDDFEEIENSDGSAPPPPRHHQAPPPPKPADPQPATLQVSSAPYAEPPRDGTPYEPGKTLYRRGSHAQRFAGIFAGGMAQ